MTNKVKPMEADVYGFVSGNKLREIYYTAMENIHEAAQHRLVRIASHVPQEILISFQLRSSACQCMLDWATQEMHNAIQRGDVKEYNATDILLLATIALFGVVDGGADELGLSRIDKTLKEVFGEKAQENFDEFRGVKK